MIDESYVAPMRAAEEKKEAVAEHEECRTHGGDDPGQRLLDAARNACLPYLLSREEIAPHRKDIAFVLVGSVATGLCTERSDVDIALLCDGNVYDEISKGTVWKSGRPTEVIIDGTQLHFYGITFDRVAEEMKRLNDAYLYVYSQTVVLEDRNNLYDKHLSDLLPSCNEIRRQRIEGKLDMLIRRSRALRSCIPEGDPITAVKIALENIVLSLKVIALLDDVLFDPRKRLFTTALSGPLGNGLEGDLRELINDLGKLGSLGLNGSGNSPKITDRLDSIVEILGGAATEQGFTAGLEKADMRAAE
jgi:predicted nucleotidyltransferase